MITVISVDARDTINNQNEIINNELYSAINNFEFRALHQHVFDEKLFIQLVNHAKFNILEIEFFRNNIRLIIYVDILQFIKIP